MGEEQHATERQKHAALAEWIAIPHGATMRRLQASTPILKTSA